MKQDVFSEKFMQAVTQVRECIVANPRCRCDVVAMVCAIATGLPSTPREHLPVWILLVATLPPESIDYHEMIDMSYRLTFPAWKRLYWRMADAYRRLEDYDTPRELRS